MMAHPGVGWVSFAIAFWIWHTPRLYELALASDAWHQVEHACFLTTAMTFWRPVGERGSLASRAIDRDRQRGG